MLLPMKAAMKVMKAAKAKGARKAMKAATTKGATKLLPGLGSGDEDESDKADEAHT